MEERMIETLEDILMPVMESSVILGGHYARACGRKTVTGKDIAYGLMYAARNVTGNHIGSLFSDDEEDEEDEDEEDDIEVVSDTDEPFTRYEGSEEMFVNMNRCADTWDTWEPTSPVEIMIKRAVDKANESVM